MSDPKRAEVERLATDIFKAKHGRIISDFGEQRVKVINSVAMKGNSAGYLPALTDWAVERLRQTISAQADAYIEAFEAHQMPCDFDSEKSLHSTASQCAAASVGNVSSDPRIKHRQQGQVSSVRRKLEQEKNTSVKEAIARMRHQSATITNRQKEQSVTHNIHVEGTNARVNIDSTDFSTNIVNRGSALSEFRQAIEAGVADATQRSLILERLTALETAPDKESGFKRYTELIAMAHHHVAIFGPYLPILAHWIQTAWS